MTCVPAWAPHAHKGRSIYLAACSQRAEHLLSKHLQRSITHCHSSSVGPTAHHLQTVSYRSSP